MLVRLMGYRRIFAANGGFHVYRIANTGSERPSISVFVREISTAHEVPVPF